MGPEKRMDDRIVAEASRWHARLAAEDCTDLDRAEFECWRASSRQHADAYEGAEALSAKLARWAKLDDRLKSMADDAFAMASDHETHPNLSDDYLALGAQAGRARRWMAPAALAATVVVAFVGVRLSGYLTRAVPPVSYASSQETRREVTLADGSIVHLDVDSEISVRLSEGQRQIALVNGRALFEVAHDATRPFVVSAGQSHTTALGTHFQVQREGHEVLVTLTEGSVAVTDRCGAAALAREADAG